LKGFCMRTVIETSVENYLEELASIIDETIAPSAAKIDSTGSYPRTALTSLGRAGLLGLISSPEVGGMGESHRAATAVVERIAQHCASTAMVVCMHYCATAVIEAYGSQHVREEIAAGRHVTTLAFSETGSRSHFWAPVSTARETYRGVRLDGHKSFSTSAGEADSYVWSSRPLKAEGESTLWFVPSSTHGLSVPRRFDGLGLRGNCSAPIVAEGAEVPEESMLGPDGGGFSVMMDITVSYFQLMSAGVSLGLMEAATAKATHHVAGTKFEHLGQSLADLPTVRAYLSRMRIKTDMVRAFLQDALDAIEQKREDAMLMVLKAKAAAGESSTEVTELAMRVCGGAAFSKEKGIERHFRDARAATVMAPTTDVLYDFIGKALCGMPLFG
jgi:alkylation response protein AidB-like acyl-CoA dehydrogenase